MEHRNAPDGDPWSAKSLAQAAGLASDAHVGMMLRGTVKKPTAETLAAIARAAGVSLDWLATGAGTPDARTVERDAPRFRDLPGWPEAEAEAMRRFKHIPPWAISAAGDLMAARAPEHVDAMVVADFARAWMSAASDTARSDAIAAQARAEMAAEDAKAAKKGKRGK